MSSADLRATLAAIAEGAAAREANDENPFAAMELARVARIGAVRLPVALGGRGFSIRQLFATVIDLAEADPAVAHILRVHYWFAEAELLRAGSTETPWIAELARGAIFGNALSELGAAAVGSLKFKTTLTPDATGYRLTGTKYYCTGTLFADWVNVFAAKDETTLAAVVVPTNRPGITMLDDWDGMGVRNTGSGTTIFENVEVRTEELLGTLRLDVAGPPSYEYAFLQLYLQAIMAGVMRNVVTDAIAVLKGRDRSFSHAPSARPADDPLLQQVLGQLSAMAFAAESTVLAATDALDAVAASVTAGVPDAELTTLASLRAAQAKTHVDEISLRASSLMFEVGGASAASRKKNLDRHWRAIRTLTLHNPTLYKAQAIGQHLLTGAPFPANGYF